MSGTGEPTDILSVADVVRDRWKVVSFAKKNRQDLLVRACGFAATNETPP